MSRKRLQKWHEEWLGEKHEHAKRSLPEPRGTVLTDGTSVIAPQRQLQYPSIK